MPIQITGNGPNRVNIIRVIQGPRGDPGPGRTILTNALTVYVRSDGSDGNDGTADTSANAFATIQAAYDSLAELDLGVDLRHTIQIADGTYDEPQIELYQLQSSAFTSITLHGNDTNPENVIINNGFYITQGTPWALYFDGIHVQSTTHPGIDVDGGWLWWNNLSFGDCSGEMFVAHNTATIWGNGNCRVAGNATCFFSTQSHSLFRYRSETITIVGTPAFSTAFAEAYHGGVAQVNDLTFVGSATGKRFSARDGGNLGTSTATLTYFPGDTAGTLEGGFYDNIAGAEEITIADGGVITWNGTVPASIKHDDSDGWYFTDPDPGASGARIYLYNNSPSPAAADKCAIIQLAGNDSAGNFTEYAAIETVIDDTTNGSEDAHVEHSAVIAGTKTRGLDVTGNGATVLAALAVPAGGTAGKGLSFSTTANFGIYFGSNVPALSAAQGSLYLRTDGSSGTTRMYVNTTGSTTWTAVNTVA